MDNFALVCGRYLCSGINSLSWSFKLSRFRGRREQKHHFERAIDFMGNVLQRAALHQHLPNARFEFANNGPSNESVLVAHRGEDVIILPDRETGVSTRPSGSEQSS